MNNHNNINFIAFELNNVKFSHLRKISIDGNGSPFRSKLCGKIIALNAMVDSILEDIKKEVDKNDAVSENEFFKSHPELNP